MPKIKHQSSRRVEALKDTDFDHEISLVDHSAPVPRTLSPDEGALRPSSSEPSAIADPSFDQSQSSPPRASASEEHQDRDTVTRKNGRSKASADDGQAQASTGPLVDIEGPTPLPEPQPSSSGLRAVHAAPPALEAAIDILYENQRGGFLCGMPLFSSKALGNLDPPPWTNVAHKPSPTDLGTAQVPDPSWVWVWPDWKINHDDGVDKDGWEYSFMFASKFSWHGPRWWNSFVRRRAWIRRRVKKDTPYVAQDPLMLNPEYFSVRPASSMGHKRSGSGFDSRRGSRTSASIFSQTLIDLDTPEKPEKLEIEDVQSLVRALRASRIDREKIEAVDSYLDHAGDDLGGLQDEMHEIMSLFVFQASRRVLLTRLTEVYEETLKQQKRGKGQDDLKRKAENLSAAIEHADEEVRRLEYWSDIKGMAEGGVSTGAADRAKGWDSSWRGLDQSGPQAPEPKE